MPKHNPSGYQKMSNDMSMSKSDLQQPDSSYSQGFENKTLSYVERQDKTCSKEAGKLKSQAYKGKYS